MQIYNMSQVLINQNVLDLQKFDLASLISEVDISDVNKLEKVPTGLNNLKSKVDKLDVDKLVTVLVDLSKLSDIVRNDVVKKDVCNAKKKHFEVKAPGIANLATNTTLNGNINEIKNEIPSITNLATTAFLTNVENKMSNVSDLVKTQIMMQKYQK